MIVTKKNIYATITFRRDIMAYSELIKNFAKIREYMSQFYIYGFKSRNEYDSKSARSYDNERRRIESWLGKYMSFHKGADSKNVFIAVDSRNIPSNPLYNAFKAKSFTSNDIMLHFCLLDILIDNQELSAGAITKTLSEEYLNYFEDYSEPDQSTVRKKLNEYVNIGLLKSRKQGNQLLFSRNESSVNLESWKNAIAFFSEEAPLGITGSYLLDKYNEVPNFFSFKHHYILHTLESEILYSLLCAISDNKAVTLDISSLRSKKLTKFKVIPLKIRVSSQGGRQYLMCWNVAMRKMALYRLDGIKAVKIGNRVENIDKYKGYAQKFSKSLWGVSSGKDHHIDHIEMTIYVDNNEEYIIKRLDREKRNGRIEKVDSNHYKCVADVYDAGEMLPWIRTFIGRITNLESTNTQLVETFKSDLKTMLEMYGGDENVV